MGGRRYYVPVLSSPKSRIANCDSGATGEAVELVKMACGVEGMVFSTGESGEVVEAYGVVTASSVGKPTGVKEALKMVKGAKVGRLSSPRTFSCC